jgi:hypothetical protein
MIGTVDPSKKITKSLPLLLLYRRIGRKKYQNLQQKDFAEIIPFA